MQNHWFDPYTKHNQFILAAQPYTRLNPNQTHLICLTFNICKSYKGENVMSRACYCHN